MRCGARPRVVVDSWYGDELATRLPDALPADALLARLPISGVRLADRCGTVRAVALLVLARGALLVTTNPSPGARTLVAIEGVLGRRRLVVLEYIAQPPGSGSRTGWLRWLKFTMLRRVLLPRALVVAQVLTAAERRGCAESHGIPEERFHHIAWPTRSTADGAVPERVFGGRRVLCSGRRVDWDTFARAATNAGWTVTAVCTAADAARVHRLLDPLGARVLTEISQTDHAVEVRAASVYVVSVPETGASIGQVRVMNAADAGTPLVVSRVAGVTDYVDQTCAVLVEPGDPDALRVEVDALLADLDRQRTLSEALLTRAGGRTMSEYLDEIAALVARHTPVGVGPQGNPPVSDRPSHAVRATTPRTPWTTRGDDK